MDTVLGPANSLILTISMFLISVIHASVRYVFGACHVDRGVRGSCVLVYVCQEFVSSRLHVSWFVMCA